MWQFVRALQEWIPSSRSARFVFCVAIALAALPLIQAADDDDEDAEAKRQQQVVAKFLTVLEKNPRRGTALDRVYGHHVEWGTLDQFVSELRKKTDKNPKD